MGTGNRLLSIDGGRLLSNEGSFIVPSLTFEKSGALSAIEGDFQRAGTFSYQVNS